MEQVLNLNTEVVKLRKDVKRVRVLIIRKLTRHIAKLKIKRGTEDAVLKNQRRAQRLLEEIHAMKKVKPDSVTKSALQDEINFEKVCKKPGNSIDDRAIARLAAHPLLTKKIADLKATVKAFKDTRQKQSTVQPSEEPDSPDISDQLELAQDFSSNKLVERKQNNNRRAKMDAQLVTDLDNKKEKNIQDQKLLVKETTSIQNAMPPQTTESQTPLQAKLKEKGPATQRKKKLALPNRLETQKETESDSKDSDEGGQEYFDDSTEERFFKQSSGPDDSDSEDDFFIGRVKRTKKKAVSKVPSAEGKADQILNASKNEVKNFGCQGMPGAKSEKHKTSGKAAKLESVFCSSLSESKQTSTSRKRNIKDHPQKKRKTASLQQCKPPITKEQPSKSTTVKQEQWQQSLHPSWEASRKRKEQLSQITVFQGKRITFDDD